MRRVIRFTVGVGAILLPGILGCDTSSSSIPTSAVTSSTTEAKVTGTVKILGKPLADGRVTFDPSNVNRKAGARTAKTDKDGHYEVTTLVGNNNISVSGKGVTDNPKVGYVSKVFDVQSGTNTFDIAAP